MNYHGVCRSPPRRRGSRVFGVHLLAALVENYDKGLEPHCCEDERKLRMFHVYIMASRRNGTLYIGSTENLNRRVWQHQTGAMPGFTARYGLKMLVWHEPHESREGAFMRERAMKKWNRAWKLTLIERHNPTWRDLALELEP